MEITKVNNINVYDIVKNPDQFPDEMIGAAIETLNNFSKQIRESKLRLQVHLMKQMEHDNASKMSFLGTDGEKRNITLKNGSFTCDKKNADEIFKENGFEPLEIGDYVFKPSWKKAKEARKVGGDKQLVIDELFQEGEKSLSIKMA